MFDKTRKSATVRIATLATALFLLPAGASFAQGAYGVLANVQTLGMPGGTTNNSNGLPLDTYEYRESDPAGGNMGTQPSNTVFGTFYAENTIAGRSASLQQPFSNLDMDYTTLMASLVIQTKVGARFTMSGRAYLNTSAFYHQTIDGTRIWDGTGSGDLTVKPVFESASGDVELVAASGVVYAPLTTN